MSNTFSKGNQGSVKETFIERINYLAYMSKLGNRHIVDFDRGEFMYYGRMDPTGKAIAITEEDLLTTLPGMTTKTNEKPKQALDFVTEAFARLRMEMSKAVATKKIVSDDKYLSELRVYRAYESPLQKYDKYIEIYRKQLKSRLKQKMRFNNMREFLPLFFQISSKTLLTVPFTYPGFIKSKYCDIMSSGLAIEIADLKYSNDHDKINKFVRSKNWDFFVNACNQHGFMIDSNRPWRIVADIGSMSMKQQVLQMHPTSGRQILHFYYEAAYRTALNDFPNLMASVYESLRKKNYAVESTCPSGKIIKNLIIPKQYTAVNVMVEFRPEFLTSYYLLLRLLETRPAIPPAELKFLLKDTIDAQFSPGSKTYVSIFEQTISKTFDKVGSLEYHYNAAKKIINMIEERMDKSMIPTIGSSGGIY